MRIIEIIFNGFNRWGIKASAFSILGLLFIFKSTTAVPTLILLTGLLLGVVKEEFRTSWIKVFTTPPLKWISLSFLLWFLSSLLISFIHMKDGQFFFPSNAFRILLASVLLWLTASNGSKKYFYFGLIVATIAAFSSGFLEFTNQNVRAQGTTNNPIHFGNMTAIVALLCISIALLTDTISNKLKIILLICFVFSLIASIFSQTRSSAMIAICIVPVFFLMDKNKFNTNLFRLFIISTLIFSIFIIASKEMQKTLRIDTLIQEINSSAPVDHAIVSGSRYELWRSAWISFKESPIVGIGPGEYENRLKKHISQGLVKPTPTFNQPHNDILHAASSGGIFHLTAYFLLLIFPFYFFFQQYRYSRRNRNCVAWNVVGMQLIFSYFLFGLTNSNFDLQIYSTTYSILICIVAKFSLCCAEESQQK